MLGESVTESESVVLASNVAVLCDASDQGCLAPNKMLKGGNHHAPKLVLSESLKVGGPYRIRDCDPRPRPDSSAISLLRTIACRFLIPTCLIL